MEISSGRKRGRYSHAAGRTMRRQCYSGGRWRETFTGQFSIHKSVRYFDETPSQEQIEAVGKVFEDYFDDGLETSTACIVWGGISHDLGIHYSQNKHKRWLLPQLLKDSICDADLHADLDFKVVLEERELIMSTVFIKHNRPDCIGVWETKTNDPEKVPGKKYSYASDLRKKSEECTPRQRRHRQRLKEEPAEPDCKMMELHYEVCYPRPEDKSPWKWVSYKHLSYVKEVKSTSKAKGQRNKLYSYWHGLSDADAWGEEVKNAWNEEEKEEKECLNLEEDICQGTSTLPSIGEVLEHLLEKSGKHSKRRKKFKKMRKSNSSNDLDQNQAISNPVKRHGKGSTIYEELREVFNNNLENDVSRNVSGDGVISEDTHHTEQDIRLACTLRISTHSILPSYLKNNFRSAYLDSVSHPRRFAVDISQRFPATETNVYVLFERQDTEGEWQYVSMEDYTNMRISLMISPHFTAVSETDFMAAMHVGSGEVHTVANVVRWSVDLINDKMMAMSDTKSSNKSPRFAVSLETVTKSSGWQLRFNTPDDIYQDTLQNSENNITHKPDGEFIMRFSPFCGICSECLVPYAGNMSSTAPRACGHWFCNGCWRKYLQSRVKLGDSNITCPVKECKSALDIVTKMSLMSTSVFFHHLNHVRDATIKCKVKWQWCPNPKCDRMVCVVEGQARGVAVNCVCGWFWCFQCMQNAHWPATCKQAAEYRELMKDRVLSSNTIPIASVEVKHCPSCNYPIEKNRDCPHMVCRMCGASFCWECLNTWTAHGYAGITLKCPYGKKSCEFFKEYAPACFNTATSMAAKPFCGLIPEKHTAENSPFSWVNKESSIASLAKTSSKGQECIKFCLEAHFIVEFLAIYLSDVSLGKRHRKQLSKLMDRLEFIIQRLDKELSGRMNFDQAVLLTKAGKSCLQQLACNIKNTQAVEKTEE